MHSYYSRLEIPSAFSLPDYGNESISGRKAITRERFVHYTGSLMMPGMGMLVGFLGGLGAVAFRYLIGLFQRLFYGSGSDLAAAVQGAPWWKVVLGRRRRLSRKWLRSPSAFSSGP